MKKSKENRRYRRPILDPIRAKEKRRRRKGTYRVRRRAVTALCVGGADALMRAAAVLCAAACGVACALCAGEEKEEEGKNECEEGERLPRSPYLFTAEEIVGA